MRQTGTNGAMKSLKFWGLTAGAVLLLGGWLGHAQAAEIGKFQVVAGKDDSSYLVDTTSGAVWVLTYRTLPTGREPIAIPYKFIKITPKDQNFLVESTSPLAPTVDKGGEAERTIGSRP